MGEHTVTVFEEFSVTVPDGLTLRGRIYGPENAADTVVCLAGLTRNGRDFHQLAEILSGNPIRPWRVVTIDSRGRGLSDRDPDKTRYTVPVEANDVLAVCDSLGIERAVFIGTSRGGLLMHLIAGLRPALLAGVVLNDIGPVVEPEGLRQIQAYLGRKRPQPRDWTEAVAAVRADHGPAFPVLSDNDWRDMARALYRETEQGITPDYDPAIAAQLVSADLSQPMPDLWPQFEAFSPTSLMVIRGEHSRLLSEATVNEMARHHPGLRVTRAAGQGHAPILHLGNLSQKIIEFLRTCK